MPRRPSESASPLSPPRVFHWSVTFRTAIIGSGEPLMPSLQAYRAGIFSIRHWQHRQYHAPSLLQQHHTAHVAHHPYLPSMCFTMQHQLPESLSSPAATRPAMQDLQGDNIMHTC